MQKPVAPKKSLWFLSFVMVFLIVIIFWFFSAQENPILASNTMQEELSTDKKNVKNQETWQESLSEVVEKKVATTVIDFLWNIFDTEKTEELWKENNENKDNNVQIDKSPKNLIEIKNVAVMPSWYPFTDIEDSPAKESILIMYSQNLFQDALNFQPKNYVRISDFIRVVVDTYRLKQSSKKGLSEKNYFPTSNLPMDVMRRINTAYELWLLQNIDIWNFEKNDWFSQFITPEQAQQILFSLKKREKEMVKDTTNFPFSSDKILLKEELAELMVQAFQLEMNTENLPVFSDIRWTAYQKAIQTLADLGIVAWVDGKFYPNAKIENKDFVTMIVKSMLAKENTSLSLQNFYYLTNLKNVSTDSPYAPYLEYCIDAQICNSLLSQESSWVSFQADRMLVWSEIEDVLSNLTETKFKFSDEMKDRTMTRWELAYLLVTSFWLDEIQEEQTQSTKITVDNVKKELENKNPEILSNIVKEEQESSNQIRKNIQEFMKIS